MYAVVTEVCQGVCKILAIVSTVGAVPTYGTMATNGVMPGRLLCWFGVKPSVVLPRTIPRRMTSNAGRMHQLRECRPHGHGMLSMR